MATSGQIGKLCALQREAGISRAELLEKIEESTGRSVQDLEELTNSEASRAIDYIEDELGGITA